MSTVDQKFFNDMSDKPLPKAKPLPKVNMSMSTIDNVIENQRHLAHMYASAAEIIHLRFSTRRDIGTPWRAKKRLVRVYKARAMVATVLQEAFEALRDQRMGQVALAVGQGNLADQWIMDKLLDAAFEVVDEEYDT